MPETGLYELRIRARQNYSRAFDAIRVLRIDGEIPFAEAEEMSFAYHDGWQIFTFGEKKPFLLQLDAGYAYLTLETVLGDSC